MPGILSYDLQDYQDSARIYRSDLLRLPILALASILQFMTLRPGVRHEEVVGTTDLDAELQPYVRDAEQDGDLDLVLRTLCTYFGTVNKRFEPNAAISTLLGHRASLASGQSLQSTPQAHEVIALTPKAIGRKLLAALFKAKRDPKGKTTMTLFNGFDTITEKEIKDGNISAANGNYMMLSERPSKINAVEILNEILDNMSPELREETCYVYCPQWIVDAYNRAYKLETGGAPYNNEYGQTCIEGSEKRLIFVPTVGKAGSKFITVSTRANMLVGVDQISDQESVKVGNYSPDTFTVMLRMFFGCQFESIDKRRLLIVEIPEAAAPNPPAGGSAGNTQDNTDEQP